MPEATSTISKALTSPTPPGSPLVCGIGLKKVSGETKEFNREHGWLAVWEKVEKNQGMQGLAIVVDPSILQQEAADKLNNLLLASVASNHTVSYWAGFVWNKTGQCADFPQWKTLVDQFAEGLRSPIEISITAP